MGTNRRKTPKPVQNLVMLSSVGELDHEVVLSLIEKLPEEQGRESPDEYDPVQPMSKPKKWIIRSLRFETHDAGTLTRFSTSYSPHPHPHRTEHQQVTARP